MRKTRSKFKWFLGIATILGVYWTLSAPSDAHIQARIVRITSDRGMCSGEQVRAPSGQHYILTAGHCDGLKSSDGSYKITTEDGKVLNRKEIAEDPNSDLLLLEGIPGVEGLDIANYSWQGERVRTFTHGRNLDTYRTEGGFIQVSMIDIPVFPAETDSDKERCAKSPKFRFFEEYGICALHVAEQVSTAFIAPGSSGGAVVDSAGELIGVASASDGTGFYFFVTLPDIKAFLRNY